MTKADRRRNRFFISIFMLIFLVCEIVLITEFGYKKMEQVLRAEHVNAAEDQDGQISIEESSVLEQETQIVEKHEEIMEKTEIEDTIPSKVLPNEESNGNNLPTQNLEPEEILADNETATGIEAETDIRSFTTVGYDYFEDALFIGDSRTVGLMEYGNLQNATFFADSGMSVFKLDDRKVYQNGNKVSFEETLNAKSYGKIYLMLGINELGYKFETFQKKYQETVEYIREHQSNAVIFLCANMHVTETQSQKDAIYNNQNVNRVNEMIAGMADDYTTFYIDANELFDDEKGNLSVVYSSDAFHVYGKHYMTWTDWLCTKAILVEEPDLYCYVSEAEDVEHTGNESMK